MKKNKLFGKLNLKKETIVKLSNDQMNTIIGGAGTVQISDTLKVTGDTARAKSDSIAAV